MPDEKEQLNEDKFRVIVDNYNTARVAEISKQSRKAGFNCVYDLSKLVEGIRKRALFSELLQVVSQQIKGKAGLDRVESEKDNMMTALNLVRDYWVADNMKWFIPQLEKEMGIKFVRSPRITSNGCKWEGYDTDETMKQYPDRKKLAKKTKEAVMKLRQGSITTGDNGFASHQAVLVQIKETMDEIKKCRK
ncbi:hypothetical protein BDV26DRAFT_294488 [Aspergillus bertholletiae]|uniref:Uncharacterized protein n=1 Tax=Aspergillus bertholletiae TaxID=1226010 RepID=A0A5N7B4G8_9EURO|nr:hypothetical protein BDV26DRAFT_294488 [Aspergillus bertholletiae]